MAHDLKVVGIGRLQLSQRRFRNGALYVSAIVNGAKIDAIDCRFFHEEGATLTPTRKGFRVHSLEVDQLGNLLRMQPDRITEQTLWAGANRKLIARRCDDEYGKGIDFRYHKTSETYEGWEQRGVRLKDDDFMRLARLLRDSGLLKLELPKIQDLFSGKTLVSSRSTISPSSRKGGTSTGTDSDLSPKSHPGMGRVRG
jgi:hypothetical protein